jgi:hypothetical protein
LCWVFSGQDLVNNLPRLVLNYDTPE